VLNNVHKKKNSKKFTFKQKRSNKELFVDWEQVIKREEDIRESEDNMNSWGRGGGGIQVSLL
jgi:hypothetical protein